MKFEGTVVFGIERALQGMRLPMSKNFEEAREKSDSHVCHIDHACNPVATEDIGTDDMRIARNLIKADEQGGSQPNSKFLRMIHVQVAITAPMFWWSEMDTYKVGTVANSTSKMHRLTSYPITRDCFELGDEEMHPTINDWWNEVVDDLEDLRQAVNGITDAGKKRTAWDTLLRMIPNSWVQTRMFDCNYSVLRNIYRWRKNHKLVEWHKFCDWCSSLPYFNELIKD